MLRQFRFGTQTVHSTEVGMKTDCLDHHFRVNAAGFYSQNENIRVRQHPAARPFGGLQIDAAASDLEFNFTRINPNASVLIQVCRWTPSQPGTSREWMGTVERNF